MSENCSENDWRVARAGERDGFGTSADISGEGSENRGEIEKEREDVPQYLLGEATYMPRLDFASSSEEGRVSLN
jgi:hypothetical protein